MHRLMVLTDGLGPGRHEVSGVVHAHNALEWLAWCKSGSLLNGIVSIMYKRPFCMLVAGIPALPAHPKQRSFAG